MYRLLCVAFLLPWAAPANALDVQSRIDAVTVYPSGATVARVADVSLVAGVTEIRLTGLVANIDPVLVRLSVDAEDVTIGQVDIKQQQLESSTDSEIVRLRTALDDAQRRQKVIEDRTRSTRLQVQFLESIATGYAKDAWQSSAGGNADIASWRAALDLLKGASGDAYAAIRADEIAQRDAAEAVDKLKRELEQAGGNSLSATTVTVALSSNTALRTRLHFQYYQSAASWRPVYEARLDSERSALALVQQAKVAQNTAEDWRNVALILSTSRPSGSLSAPTLDSQFLDLTDPRRLLQRGAVQGLPSIQEVVVTANRDAPKLNDDPYAVRADVGSFATNYVVPGRSTVINNSDSENHFEIDRFAISPKLITQAAPRRSLEAFLSARFVFEGNTLLYAGDMRVFVDGVYAGVTKVEDIAPQAQISLPLGRDPGITISAENQGGQGGESGIIGRRKQVATDFLYRIVNRRSASTEVEVLDWYPTAVNRSIDIKIPDTATPPTEKDLDDKPGLIAWRKQLAANERWEIRHQYTISHPLDRALVEGEPKN